VRGRTAGRPGKAASRARRKRALTGASSPRWAGAITRTTEDQHRLAGQNLRAEATRLRTRIARIEARLAIPAGGGTPVTVPLDLAGLSTSARDGRLRAAISGLIATARQHGAHAVVIEDLDFIEARVEGRERTGTRPARGRRGRGFRRAVVGIPTGKFRDRLVQMTANAGLSVIVTDPAYTSRWGAQHWLAPMQEHHPETTGHHAPRW
jgi:hypothetical protein